MIKFSKHNMRIIHVKAKQLFVKTRIPGADWAVNQYVGCQHACSYCYAKFVQRWYNYGPWGSWVIAKENAPELARNYHKGLVVMSTISDPYQPVEKELELTKRVLENLDPRTRLSLLTKSDLVTRDMDLLRGLAYAEVGLTIGGFPREVEERFEPLAPSSEKRVKALNRLHNSGLKTYTFVSPIIPGLNDIDLVIQEAKEFSDFYWFEFLNLPAAGRTFRDMLRREFPGADVSREAITKEERRIRELAEKSGINVKGIVVHAKDWLR